MAVIDANVLLRASMPSTATRAARDAIGEDEAMAPAIIAVEAANALWRHVRAGDIDQATAGSLLQAACASIELMPVSPSLLKAALDLACELRHPVYDCLYLALALRQKTGLVTADLKLAELARRKRVAVELLP